MHRSEKTRRRRLPAAIAFTLLAVPPLALAHDMFLVVPDHDLPANSAVTVSLYNGTFDKSENAIARDRMTDVSIVDGAGQTSHPAADQWREQGNVTLLDFRTGEPGTYVVGVSTAARVIELSAADFNEYLAHDGVLDVLAERERQGQLDEPASELYSKHVKTILTVGGASSKSWSVPLDYPIEIVPLVNPAELATGGTLEVLVLANGEPAANQLVYASYAGHHAHDDSGTHREAVTTRTDTDGKAAIEISQTGRWYLRLIRMLPVERGEAEYESNWATLTFKIGN